MRIGHGGIWRRSLIGAVLIIGLAACAPTRTRESTGEVIDDTVITTKVKTALITNPTTKARQIDVETYKGVVQLSGFVDDAAEKAEAGRIAAQVGGVTNVRNELAIKHP